MALVLSGFMIGLLGSLHCLGMCGPLAMAIPVKNGNNTLSGILYVVGKSMTYALIGLGVGLIGMSIRLSGFQSAFSIVAGAMVLAYVFFPSVFSRPSGLGSYVQRLMGDKLKTGTSFSVFALGALNGLLPCGLVYIALAGAIETGYVELAALYMFLFGLGTSVLLLVAIWSKQWFYRFKGRPIAKLLPVFYVLIAALFIARGVLGLIPPEQTTDTVEIMKKITMCH